MGEFTGMRHFGIDVETYCSGNYLELMRVTLERTPSNGGDGA